MTAQEFHLQPFAPTSRSGEISICSRIMRDRQMLSMHYELTGFLDKILVPAAESRAERRNELWKETCFEFFLRMEGSDMYWEFNLSPAGHWNVYRFASYREGMQEERAFTALPFVSQKYPGLLQLDIEINLSSFVPPDRELRAAISAVVNYDNNTSSYWALVHPGAEPDFHHSESFIAILP